MTRLPRSAFPTALLLFVLVFIVAVRPAGAHANLLQSTPPANAVLDRAPVQIELLFSEPLEDNFSSIEVLDTAGNRVDNEDAGVDPADPTRMTVTVRSLPDGIYTVSWRTLSTVDGHVTAGAFPFAVGEVDEAALAAAQSGTTVTVSPVESLARWLTYAGILTLVGGSLFILLVWHPAIRRLEPDPTPEPNWQRLALVAILLLIVGTLLWVLAQAGQVTGGVMAFPWDPAVFQVLFTTRFGALILARLLLALLMVPLLLVSPTNTKRIVALVLGLLVLLTISLGSHAAAEADPLLPILADWVHLAMASFWVGGLVYFTAAMLATRPEGALSRAQLAAGLIPRFSALALVSVALLVLTGVYASLLQLTALAELTTTAYGQTLLVKLVIFTPMLLLGAANLLFTSPRMKKAAQNTGSPSLVSRFRRMVTSEATLGIAVLLSVGLLTTLPTPSDLNVTAGFEETQSAEDLEITLAVNPGRVGVNTYTVTVLQDGRPLDNTKAVELQFTPTTSGLPPSEVQLTAQGNGTYSVEGAYFGVPDAYQVRVAVRRNDTFDTFANYDLSVGGVSAAASADGQTFAWHQFTGLLAVFIGVAFLFALWPFMTSPLRRATMAGAPALLIGSLGIYVFLVNPAPPVDFYPANPIPPNSASIANGEALYLENCLPCHGPNGAGDGPVGVSLNPPPADLTEHTAPGVHTDGRLYDWITNGFAGSVMPAFQDRLTDEQRWHLVNYIRTFSPESELTTSE
jgi:copper transport protein